MMIRVRVVCLTHTEALPGAHHARGHDANQALVAAWTVIADQFHVLVEMVATVACDAAGADLAPGGTPASFDRQRAPLIRLSLS